MAGVTFRPHHCTKWFRVTSLTFYIAVTAIKHEVSAAIMIKMPCEPSSRDMTRFTFVAQCFLVDVFLFVTTNTSFRSVTIATSLMTGFTSRRSMTASQRKFRLIVVKERFLPLCVRMASHAILAKLTFVNIVFLVA